MSLSWSFRGINPLLRPFPRDFIPLFYLTSCPVRVYSFSPRRIYICPSRRILCAGAEETFTPLTLVVVLTANCAIKFTSAVIVRNRGLSVLPSLHWLNSKPAAGCAVAALGSEDSERLQDLSAGGQADYAVGDAVQHRDCKRDVNK